MFIQCKIILCDKVKGELLVTQRDGIHFERKKYSHSNEWGDILISEDSWSDSKKKSNVRKILSVV